MSPRRPDTSAIFRRYGAAASVEWQRVGGHFALNEGFALVVLVVPDRDGASLCRLSLANRLRAHGLGILDASPASPSALRRLAPSLLALRPERDRGAVWVSAAVPASADDFAAWRMAWRWGLATLNQNRNPLRRWIGCSLVIVGTPELVPLFREAAPDLWSVRSLVAHILPDPTRLIGEAPHAGRAPAPRRDRSGSAPDLDTALRAIDQKRGVMGQEVALADAVERAARAYADRGDLPAAELCFREALDLRERFDTRSGTAASLLHLGDILLDQGRSGEAASVLRRGVALSADADLALRGRMLDVLAHSLLAQGQLAEAERAFQEGLALARDGGAGPLALGVTTDMMARAVLAQGRTAEAESLFRHALGLINDAGAPPLSLGVTLEMLAHAVLAQGRAAEAAGILRRSLALAEQGGASAVSRAVTTRTLAQAMLARGRKTEAQALLRGAMALAREGGASEDLVRMIGGEAGGAD